MTAILRGGAPVRRRAGAIGGLLAAVGAFALVLWRAPVLVHQCVAGDGLAGALGLRLALLRVDSTCPSGTLAVGIDGAQAAGVVVMVAVPVLLLHLVVAGAGAGVLAAGAALVRTLGRALARALPALPTTVVLPVADLVERPRERRVPALVSWSLPVLGLRGPPTPVC